VEAAGFSENLVATHGITRRNCYICSALLYLRLLFFLLLVLLIYLIFLRPFVALFPFICPLLKKKDLTIPRVWYELKHRIVGTLFPVGTRNISLLSSVQTGSGAHPNFLSNMHRGLLHRGLNRPKRELDHSPSPSTEVKNSWSFTSYSLRGA
jgi:hypothetical protein